MSATDELRAKLTKRGVEYEVDDGKTVRVTRWKAYGEWVSFIEYDTGETRFCTDMRRFTPEQAIAATLGNEDTYTREDVEGAFVSGYSLGLDMFDSSKPDSEKGWNQNERNLDEEMEDLGWVRKDSATLGPTDPRESGLIPHFWTGDWTLHIEAARLPERIDVTLPDQRGREVYSARVHRFVPERTCRKVYLVETSDDLIESWYPIGIYLRKETAEDCAESLRGEHVGIKHFARVVELEVIGE